MEVVFFHFVKPVLGERASFHGFRPLIANGFIAVGLFFMLSGFVLAYNYVGKSFSSRTFWKARFARIYPLYFIAFLLTVPLVLVNVKTHNPHLAYACEGECGLWVLIASLLLTPLMLQSWSPQTTYGFNPPGWSLSAEAFFYFAFPFLLPLAVGLSSWKALMTLLLSVWFASLMVPLVVAYHIGISPTEALTLGGFAWTSPLAHLPTFIAGVALGCLYAKLGGGSRLHASRWLGDALVLAGSAVLVILLYSPAIGRLTLAIHTGLLIPVWACIIMGIALGGVIARLLTHPTLVFLGNASYAIYILQNPLSSYFRWAFSRITGTEFFRDFQTWPTFLAFGLLLIAASMLSYKFVEIPMRRRITQTTPSTAKSEITFAR